MEESTVKDLTLRCSSCKNFFGLPSAMEHKKHHRAMRIMRFKEGKGPRNLESLTKRHMTILQKTLAKSKDAPSDPSLARQIEKINEAYETLRFEFTKDDFNLISLLAQDGMTSMRDGYFEPRDKIVKDQVCTKVISTPNESGFPSCIYGIGQSQAINTDWRDVMEDATLITSRLPGFHFRKQNDLCFVGMFDGHHGATASHSCAESICDITSQQFLRCRNNNHSQQNACNENLLSMEIEDEAASELVSDSDIAKCLTESYLKMDEYLSHGINESSRLRWSGCSALTCAIVDEDHQGRMNERGDGVAHGQQGQTTLDKTLHKNSKIGKVYVSNAGNVRAVLYHKKKPHFLSELHSLENENEQKRVLNAGGTVIKSERYARVYGVLDTTRGLGNHGDPRLKECVIATPHVTTATVTRETQMLVIATNSVWDILSPSDVFSVLTHSIPSDAATVLRSGPKPIVPVIHGNLRGRRGGADGEGPHISSALPSIVETEEEREIEEVIFVQAQDSDSDDGEEPACADNLKIVDSAAVVDNSLSADSATEKERIDRDKIDEFHGEDLRSINGNDSTSGDDSVLGAGDSSKQKEQSAREKYARVASVLSHQLVRAAIGAGAVENVSVVVILFEGMFLV